MLASHVPLCFHNVFMISYHNVYIWTSACVISKVEAIQMMIGQLLLFQMLDQIQGYKQ